MQFMRSIKDLSLANKRVLLRVDFNVPIKNGQITDDSRIRASLPTIQYILDHGASLILMSHLGKPDGKPNPELSLAPCAKRLSALLKKPVLMAPDCIGAPTKQMASHLQPGQILMLENLRFHTGEEHPEKDPGFTKELASLGDTYVNDAFGTAHRAHASTTLIAKFFPHAKAAGFLMQKEIDALTPLLHNPKRPFYAIIGGAKISTKIGVIQKLLSLVDELFIGGGMSYTFLKAQGIAIGKSMCEDPKIIKDLPMSKIHLPLDLVLDNGKTINVKQGIPEAQEGMDIGPKTVEDWSQKLVAASTVFWNGPLGAFEDPRFAIGTQKIAEFLSQTKAKVIIGGGDSVAAIEQMGLSKKFAHLSTGGGASLEFLELGHLPGIDALS